MESVSPARFERLKFALTALLCVWLIGMTFWWNNPRSIFELRPVPHFPFGFTYSPEGGIQVQDFAYNLVYFHGIHDDLVPRPYRLEDQEKLIRMLLPGMNSGLSHGYSPVAYVLALPLLAMSGARANLVYAALGTVAFLLLFYFYLRHRVVSVLGILAMALCAVSFSMALTYGLGQSSLLTVPLLGALWALLQRRADSVSLGEDVLLAALFWALCLKPSVAIIPGALLLGAFAWRPLLLGMLALVLTWLLVAPHYGGWWTGLRDYAYLLNHYNNEDFTPFMRRDYVPGHATEVRGLFLFNRLATEIITAILIVLRWLGRITPSELYQALIGVFLLFSPYLLPSEDWILCLLVAESPFFRDARAWPAAGKLLVLFSIMNLRGGLIVPFEIHAQMKFILFGWLLLETIAQRRNRSTVTSAVLPAPI